MGVHFTFEFNLGDRRRQADPTRKLSDVIFDRFSIDLDMSHHQISITSQRIEPRNSWSGLPSGLPLNLSLTHLVANIRHQERCNPTVKRVTSKLMTDVADEMCWWRQKDVGDGLGDGFYHQNPLSFCKSVEHQHSKDVTNIEIQSPTSTYGCQLLITNITVTIIGSSQTEATTKI